MRDNLFLEIPRESWLCENELAFAVADGFPVTPGHTLVITKRQVPTWFDCTPSEQQSLMDLVNVVRDRLDRTLQPRPDGYNVGFNAGTAAGQTVPHVHVHVIPRYAGDVDDPRGGVRHVIPGKGNYLRGNASAVPGRPSAAPPSLSTGHPDNPLWPRLAHRLPAAAEIDILAAFVQPSGLDVVQSSLFAALRAGAAIRILVGDYLGISSPEALRRLFVWNDLLAAESIDAKLAVRLVRTAHLRGAPESFHPKAWRIADAAGALAVVGSSNLSRAALVSGVEWNVLLHDGAAQLHDELNSAFSALWDHAVPLSPVVIAEYTASAAAARAAPSLQPETEDAPAAPPEPRPWQSGALEKLAQLRHDGFRRALIAVATGLGKTWLAAFDAIQMGQTLGHCPRILVVAHRAEILTQAEATLRSALSHSWPHVQTSWFLGPHADSGGDLVIASVQKLTRPEGLAMLDAICFDYAIIDEVHHANAPSYRRVLARLRANFTLGLTATPERADGQDVAALFDDVLAWQATIGDGISEGSLVPFHYTGLKDDVDFSQIPWRSGRFDPDILELKLENSERMERLWKAWQTDADARTIVFCCSQRHARFVRQWLQQRGVEAAAVFAGDGSDPRADSMERFASGSLRVLCAVDLFNEGLDIPAVDRIVMLRPTESKVIFLQQLGRGLRASDGKSRLKVIDFVGNHRVFASRMIHLLSLTGERPNWDRIRDLTNGAPLPLPPGCIVDVQLEAIDLLRSLLPSTKGAAVEAYRSMRDDLGRRPTPSELFFAGYLPSVIVAKAGSWFDFVHAEKDFSPAETEAFLAFEPWLTMLGTTQLFKSYKMIVLRVLLDNGSFWDGMDLVPLAAACRTFLLAHPTLRADLPPTKEFPDPANAPIEHWAQWWAQWPLSKWKNPQSGRSWFELSHNRFYPAFDCPNHLRDSFAALTSELVDFRLAQYIQNRLAPAAPPDSSAFEAKVSHSGGKPILFLPTVEKFPNRPTGPTSVSLPDGSAWIFHFVKVAVNKAYPAASSANPKNELAALLTSWFGPDAGLPGTNFHVSFSLKNGSWHITPDTTAPHIATAATEPNRTAPPPRPALVESPPAAARFASHVPFYTLEPAAGLWSEQHAPEIAGWIAAPGHRLRQGMFAARIRGHSMEPTIPDGALCLFQTPTPGSRNGRIVLVQLNSLGDPETGGRFTVKKYLSSKSPTDDSWSHSQISLVPINPSFPTIPLNPSNAQDLLIIGEFIAVIEGAADKDDSDRLPDLQSVPPN